MNILGRNSGAGIERRFTLVAGRWGGLLLLMLLAGAIAAMAQSQRGAGQASPRKDPPALTALDSSRDELARLTNEYKKSLARLADSYRADLERAQAQLARTTDLFDRGLVAKRDRDARESEVAELNAKLEALGTESIAADEQMADMLTEADAIAEWARTPPPVVANNPGRVIVGSSFIRYTGLGSWNLAGATAIKAFFLQRFGRPLPISAFGQSHLHDMWRWDHRNAMDVGINPTSVEGQALIVYLQAHGVPFGAFRQAIPGVATGPHIHVGMPSHRLAAP